MTDAQTKKELPKILSIFKKLFQIILYIPIQIIFIPFAIIGLIVGIYREMVIGQKLGVSFSAIKALQYRWNAHYFNLRPDTLSVEFIKKLPCESHFGLWSLLGPLIISKRLFGLTTGAVKLVEPEETFDLWLNLRPLYLSDLGALRPRCRSEASRTGLGHRRVFSRIPACPSRYYL